MSDIEWSPWIKNHGECPDLGYVRVKVRFRRGDESGGISTASEWPHWDFHGGDMAITHYRIPMEDYRRITGMPEWSEAPEWAQWLAQDLNGHWYWYSHEPHKEMSTWDVSDMIHRHTDKPMTVLGCWEDTLQERPRDQLDSHPNSEPDADECSVVADTLEYDPEDVAFTQDNVNTPSHYASGEIECIDAIQAQMTPEQFAGYLRGNVAKYVWRYQHKGGKESLLKAQWYLNRLIDVVE